jgi:hypothetical protein
LRHERARTALQRIRSYGGYPDIDSLFRDQATYMDAKRREGFAFGPRGSTVSGRQK